MKFFKTFMQAGIKSSFSPSKARSIRIGNLVTLTALLNTLFFAFIFWFMDDLPLTYIALGVAAIYVSCYLVTYGGYPTVGRILLLVSGNLIIFYLANFIRGDSGLELLLFSLAVAPFMFFSWEERGGLLLALLSVFLFAVGEFYSWNLFTGYNHNYGLKLIKILSIITTFNQIIWGFFYFVKQNQRYEVELEVEHSKQVQVQKMSSLGEMAGGISHEVNNPLMIILGQTHYLKRELRDKDESGLNHVVKIEAMVERISKIIRSLNNFARKSADDPTQYVELISIVDSTLDLCRERFTSHGVKLEVQIAPNLSLSCRPTEISQVLLNLLNNAFDSVKNKDHGFISIKGRKILGMIEILVEDNGGGIPKEIRDKIMQPFFTTKEIGKGTGLGLSISKGLIEAHQGSLTLVTSGNLTTFKIILPI